MNRLKKRCYKGLDLLENPPLGGVGAVSKNKGIRAKIVPGGATGLVQQRVKNYPHSKKRQSMKQDIKNQCNSAGDEMVLMQFGSTFDIVDDNAEYFHKEFGFEYNPQTVNFYQTGFPLASINKYKTEFLKRKINFCIVEEVLNEKGKNIIREVTFSSSNSKSLELIFIGGEKK